MYYPKSVPIDRSIWLNTLMIGSPVFSGSWNRRLRIRLMGTFYHEDKPNDPYNPINTNSSLDEIYN